MTEYKRLEEMLSEIDRLKEENGKRKETMENYYNTVVAPLEAKVKRYENALKEIATDPNQDGDWSDTAEMFYRIASNTLEVGKNV